MARIYVANHVTLDGVMQGPAREDEDTSGGFTAGGWSNPAMGPEIGEALNARVTTGGGMRLLLGRRSYDDMLGYWNTTDSPFKDGLNHAEKHVVSSTLADPPPWPNTTVIFGDVVGAVRAVKERDGADLCIMGSGQLIRTLLSAGLIDEFLLFVHPVVLGSGRRLFADGLHPERLHLLEATPTPTGVIIAHYGV